MLTAGVINAQKICCPQFNLVPDMEPCPDSSYRPPIYGQGGQGKDCDLSACKHTTDNYLVLPNKTGYTYTWIITGGTAASATGNPMKVTWGNGDAGSIKIFISNQDGTCIDTITKEGCLKDAPVANFSFSPGSPFCLNQAIQFTNSSVGATSYYWDFGDGSSSNQLNPLHSFTSPGTYTIVLAVSNKPPAVNPIYPQQDYGIECGCRDTIRKTITVKNTGGINIVSGCKKMLCKGDTASYCTTNQCSGYNWTVTGGHISGAANGTCITVVWDGTYPAAVSLSGNCGGTCGNSGTLNVPVLYPSMPIQGNTIVCPSSFTTYTLPAMPGTFYNWQLSGGGTILGANSNTSVINISWGATTGNYTITCNYHNPITGCSGSGTLAVYIKPKFQLMGPSPVCVGSINNYLVMGGGSANWNITPITGYTPPGTPPGSFNNIPNIGLTWNAAGNYNINAVPVIPANYCTASATINVIVNPIPVLNPIVGNTTICPSQLYNYSVSSNVTGGNFAWNFISGTGTITPYGNANSSASINFTGTGPWTLQVTQTVNGCTGTSPVVTINRVPPPSVITIIPSGNICSGGIIIATVSGGAPPYTWSCTPGAVLIGGQGTTTATFTVNNSNATITVSDCGGNISINVTTTPATVTISQTTGTCSAVLTASPGGGTYNWYLNGNPVGTGNPITVNQPGTYVVQATYSGGCMATSQITVNFTPVVAMITATGNLCNGPVNLQAILQGNCVGATYTWSNGGSGPSITVNTPGSYSVTVVCNGCTVTSNIIVVSPCPTGGGVGGNCINNAVITPYPSNCNNPVNLTATAPGCTPVSTSWLYGDGFGGSTGTHYYNNVGTYNVLAVISCADGSKHCGTSTVTIPMVDSFTHIISCGINGWSIQLHDASLFIVTYSGYTTNWTTTCGTLSAANIPNPVLTVPFGCNPTVTLTISKNGCTLTSSYTFNFPNTPLSINGSSTVCQNVSNSFSSSFTTGVISYNWNFGDATTGVTNPISHAFNGIPPNPTITLSIKDQYGCIFTATKPITLIIPTPLTITPSPLVKICPGCLPLVTLTTHPPAGFTGYQWYQNGTAIAGATNSTFQLCNFNAPGNYYVTATSSSNNCPVTSDTVNVLYNSLPVTHIKADAIQCTANMPIRVQNIYNESGVTYSWIATGPGSVTFSPGNSYNPAVTIAGSTPGEYQFILTAVNAQGCISKDTFCITLVQSPTVTVNAPAGTLCEGQVYTFTATASPNINPENYIYQWSNGVSGNTMSTGKPGTYTVFVVNPSGCKAMAFAGTINGRPDISLFPVGCDTLCLTDTLHFPLPMPAPAAYSITWYDDDGTAITNVGNGFILPLSNLQPGIHHLHAIVSFAGGCADTTDVLDLYVKDCTLLPPCNTCPGLLGSASVTTENNIASSGNYQLNNSSISFTILKPVKEVRISLAELKYYWKDTSCNNCKVQMIERGCLFPTVAGENLGTLVWDDYTTSNIPPNTATDKCPGELVWKNGTPLLPGTYTVPLQLSLPKPTKDKCQLVLSALCFHLTVIDTSCSRCDTWICKKDDTTGDDCKCNAANTWTGLYLLPQKPGIPKPHNLILCNTTLTDILSNTPYVLTGVYHCQGKCASTKNEITVYNQVNQIIYTHVTAALNETILFPAPGMYSVSLSATCGTQKCICAFKVYVTDGKCLDCDTTITAGCKDCPTPITGQIDSVIHQILPPDFNGGILVARNDSVLYEKYVSYKDSVNGHTPFDLASITKTFTGMAILKLMEEGKLNIDDAVSKYLPEFPIPEITIKMLLSHRSGLEDYLAFMDESGWDKTKNVTNKDLLQFIAGNKSKVLINVPGKVYYYSNTNFALLSLIIEKLSGQSYKDYLTVTFFKPLQMNDTYILTPENFATSTRSYYKNGKTYPARYLDFITGDKCVYSTVQDLKKWDKALRGGKLFKKSTLDMAYAATSPVTAFTGNYGLGWKTVVTANGKAYVYHTGNWAGSRSILIRLLKENVIIAVVSNNNFTNIADIRKLCDLFGDYQQSNKKILNF